MSRNLQPQLGESRQTVARRNRDSSRPSASQADWLGREHIKRQRPWALEEQLLGCRPTGEGDRLLRVLAERLADERTALSQIERELQEQMQKVSELEWQLGAIAAHNGDRVGPSFPASTAEPRPPRTVLLRPTSPPPDHDYWLARCEGFVVESPTGRHVGLVEGIRFAMRIDRPDLLEVVAGRLRRRMLLVPIEEVESISGDDERVVLSHDPLTRRNFTHGLLAKAGGKLHISPS